MDNLVIQITTDSYGCNSDGLGENLMKSYLYALTETTPRPNAILLINKGAYLTAENSSVLDSLKKLEKAGTEILTCSTCIDFYKLSKTPAAGAVTNMYTMAEKLNNAGNAIVI